MGNIFTKSSLLSAKEALTDSNFDVDSIQYIVDALEICLTYDNSKFNYQTRQNKVSNLKFITTYNPELANIHNIIQNNLSILHTD